MELACVALAATALCLTCAVVVLRRRLQVVHVSGASMQPHLRSGDRVIVARRPSRYARGDVVVLIRTDLPEQAIKRIAAVAGDRLPDGPGVVPPDHVFVLGDNPRASVDSRHFGAVPVERVTGRMIRRLA